METVINKHAIGLALGYAAALPLLTTLCWCPCGPRSDVRTPCLGLLGLGNAISLGKGGVGALASDKTLRSPDGKSGETGPNGLLKAVPPEIKPQNGQLQRRVKGILDERSLGPGAIDPPQKLRTAQ